MRLSEWRAAAPHRESMSTKVLAVVEPIVGALGGGADPESWVAWGDDPASRYTVLVPTPAGLIIAAVRVNIPMEGPRASGKLVRWNRVQVGELGMETQGPHRLLSFQVEGTVLRGVDAEADGVAAFALLLFAGMDGRLVPAAQATRGAGAERAARGAKFVPKASTAEPGKAARGRSAG